MNRWRYEPRRRYLDPAFEPFVTRDPDGRAKFANRWTFAAKPFRERVWPVFRRSRLAKRRKRPSIGFRHELFNADITRDARLAAARRWLPDNPLSVHAMRVEDAWRARVYFR
jgi:hypothetical protein